MATVAPVLYTASRKIDTRTFCDMNSTAIASFNHLLCNRTGNSFNFGHCTGTDAAVSARRIQSVAEHGTPWVVSTASVSVTATSHSRPADTFRQSYLLSHDSNTIKKVSAFQECAVVGSVGLKQVGFKIPGKKCAETKIEFDRARVIIAAIAEVRGETVDEVEDQGKLNLKEEVLITDPEQIVNKVEYNWENEWYPLYLVNDIPRDAPLGLSVFDRPLVLYYDGDGVLHCFEDQCPHRLAKLSEGQIMDGKLECLYHGWQFNGDGSCAKIPQLPAGAKIPRAACVRSYSIQESQGVVWVWVADMKSADRSKIPWFEHYARPDFQDISSMQELPYDHSILLENLMDPAHINISHDRTDPSGKRENAQALNFEVTERTSRGFAGKWGESSSGALPNTTRFEAPCVLRNDKTVIDKDGNTIYYSALFLCCPAGQGRSMLTVRFGSSKALSFLKWFPTWLIHRTANTVFEQDMGFLSSQNATMIQRGVPTKDLYLNLKSSDTWVSEYRKWLDKVGHGMPYYIGHRTLSLPPTAAVVEAAPVGLVAATASSYPSKGAIGTLFARDHTNRYFRHVIHCNDCRKALKDLQKVQRLSQVATVCSASIAILASNIWRVVFVLVSLLTLGSSYVCSLGVDELTTNFVRAHRK